MKQPAQVAPEEVRKKTAMGQAILVCAHEEPEMFEQARLERAISLLEFESYLSFISRKQEIVFYCSPPDDGCAIRRAADFLDKGFKNAKVLAGGTEAWKRAGLPVAAAAAEDS